MPNDDRMSIDERRKYLRIVQEAYLQADRKGRGVRLHEMQLTTGLSRNYLISLIKTDLRRKPRRRQRGPTYGREVQDALRVISRSYNVCPELQAPGLSERALHLAGLGRLELTPRLLEQLKRISPSTLRRIYKRQRQDEPSLPRRSPSPTNEVARSIPMQRIPWDVRDVGHFEVDLVSYSGAGASGDFAYTLQMVDVATAWSERVALLGRSALVTLDALSFALHRLPFLPLQFHFDNGPEFMNRFLIRYLRESFQDILISRSRPYNKNDSRFVEQKNGCLVRAYLGYGRFDTARQVNAINQLYEKLWLYDNFFRPTVRLIEKRIGSPGGPPSPLKRIHDRSCTPFSRLCSAGALPEPKRRQLEALYASTDPIALLEEIHELIDHICAMPGATPGRTEDVFPTLHAPLTQRKERATR